MVPVGTAVEEKKNQIGGKGLVLFGSGAEEEEEGGSNVKKKFQKQGNGLFGCCRKKKEKPRVGRLLLRRSVKMEAVEMWLAAVGKGKKERKGKRGAG